MLRYLCGEPVSAHPSGAGYRVKKFVRRHKGQVVAAALVLAVLLAGVAGTTWQAVRAERRGPRPRPTQRRATTAADGERLRQGRRPGEGAPRRRGGRQGRTARQEAERQRAFAEAISQFVRDDFLALTSAEGQDRFSGDNGFGLSRDTTLRQLLDRAAAKLRDRTDLDPLIDAELSWIVGVNYRALGAPGEAIGFLERAVALRTAAIGRDHRNTLRAMNSLGAAYVVATRYDQASPLLEEAVRLMTDRLGPDDPTTLVATCNLAASYRESGRNDLALPLCERAVALAKARLGPEDPVTLSAVTALAHAYGDAGRFDLALPLYEQVLAARTARLGPDHTSTLAALDALATACRDAGKHDRALPLLERLFPLQRDRLGPDDPDTLATMLELDRACRAAGKAEPALRLYEQALALAAAPGPTTRSRSPP